MMSVHFSCLSCSSFRFLLTGFLMMLFVQGCADSATSHEQLKARLAEIRQQPKGRITQPPTFRTHESFIYSATLLRSPFQKPIEVETKEVVKKTGPQVEPDFMRPPEVLEQFSLETLTMVGTIKKQDKSLYALVKDNKAQVHRVKTGNFIGKNHGKVVSVNEKTIDLIEIIPDGQKGWTERPRTIVLKDE